MNIYQKIQSIRVKLAKDDIKKTGKNTYSNFAYYELSDFLPKLNEYLEKNGLFTSFSILSKRVDRDEVAVLKIIDSEEPKEKVIFKVPTAEAQVGVRKDGTGGADPIQNQGAKITYMRRYLLMIAFEIVEQDVVDSQPQKNGVKKVVETAQPRSTTSSSPASEKQKRMFFALAKDKWESVEMAKEFVKTNLGLESFNNITVTQLSAIINRMLKKEIK